jgi:hypothetical protein
MPFPFPGKATPGIEEYALFQVRAVPSSAADTRAIIPLSFAHVVVMAMAVIRDYKPHGQRWLSCLGKRVNYG